MRGDVLMHNQLLVKPLTRLLESQAVPFSQEVPVGPGAREGYVDLFAVVAGAGVVIEAERTADRIDRDVAKARALGAALLLIVVPNRRVARAAQRRLRKLAGPRRPIRPAIWILPLGLALKRLGDLLTILDWPQCPVDIKSFDPGPSASGDIGASGGKP